MLRQIAQDAVLKQPRPPGWFAGRAVQSALEELVRHPVALHRVPDLGQDVCTVLRRPDEPEASPPVAEAELGVLGVHEATCSAVHVAREGRSVRNGSRAASL